MPGPAGGGRSGNGEDGWPTLVKQAEDRAKELDELVGSVGPDYEPSLDLLGSVGKVELCLRNLIVLLDQLRPYLGELQVASSGQPGPLGVFRGSVLTAQVTLAGFKAVLYQELRQRAYEEERHRYRSNKRYRKDQNELRATSLLVQSCLTELQGHMNGILNSLSGS